MSGHTPNKIGIRVIERVLSGLHYMYEWGSPLRRYRMLDVRLVVVVFPVRLLFLVAIRPIIISLNSITP